MGDKNHYSDYIEAIQAGVTDPTALLKLFYLPGIDDTFTKKYSQEVLSEAGKTLLDAMLCTDAVDIIDILDTHENELAPIKTGGIPQFSEFGDADIVLRVLMANEGCDFEYIGYVFHKTSQESAQYKYGENHYKLCYQLGLAEWAGRGKSKKNTKISYLGRKFLEYSGEDRENLRAKLCLRIPIIQRELVAAKHGSVVGLKMILDAGLAQSTAIRRRSSMKQMLRAISTQLPEEYDYTENIIWDV